MHDVYVYDGKAQSFDGLGLVGALFATSCIHDEEAGGDSVVTLEHPFDDAGKWTFLQKGCILKCWVPVRETPLLKMGDGSTAQTVTRQVYKVDTNGSRLHLRKGPNTSSKIIGRYKHGTEVVKLADAGISNGTGWYQVSVVEDGSTGYMAASNLEYVRSYTESTGGGITVESTDTAGSANWTVRPQLFEIYRKEANDEGIVVYARHISYKLLKNVTTYESTGAVALQTALNGILGNCRLQHDFKAYTDIKETRDDISWRLINPIKAMLDNENGALTKWGAQLIRDNWDLFFLKRAGGNRGMRIEYGKNLVGVEYSEDLSDVATRIIPVGKNEDGTDLFLPEEYIDSEKIDNYNEPMVYVLECSDCKVGKETTVDQAYEKMRKAAKQMLENGCDQPNVSIQIDFISLGDSAEYAQFRDMDKLFLYDEVEIVSLRGFADGYAQITSLSWDCLNDRALGMGVGSIAATLSGNRLTSWQIPSGISGGKITYGSIGAAQLGSDVISTRHIQAGSINAEALQAKSVTAEKIAAGAIDAIVINAVTAHIRELVAGNITTDKLYADLAIIAAAQITAANIDKANINWAEIQSLTAQIATIAKAQITTANIKEANITWAEIENLNAQIAEIAQAKIDNADIDSAQIKDLEAVIAKIFTAEIGSADIGFAQIKDLVTNTAIITEGVGGELYIARLAVTEANMVRLSVGELLVKGEDGHFYSVGVGEDGNIKTTLKQVVNDDVADNTIHGTDKLIEGSITAQTLNVQNIFGDSAIIRELIAANLDVATLFAREATINELNAVDIRGNKYLRMLVEGTSPVWRGETAPTDGKNGNLWIQPSTGLTYQLADDVLPEISADGMDLYYTYAAGQAEYAFVIGEDGNLYADDESPFTYALSDDCRLTAWQRVKDSELDKAAQDAMEKANGAMEKAEKGEELIAQQAATIQLMQDQINLRVTEKVFQKNNEELGQLIAENESAIKLQADEIQSRVTAERFDEATGEMESSISAITQRADSLEASIIEKVDGKELRTYVRYGDGKVEIGNSASRYVSQTSDNGFVILQDGIPMTQIVQNRVSAPVIEAERQFQIGKFAIRTGNNGELLIL